MTTRITIVAILAIALAGCAAKEEKKAAPPKHAIDLICVQENPDVRIDDLLTAIRNGLQRHGVDALPYQVKPPARCRYTLWYTVSQGWQLGPYIKSIELRLRRANEVVAEASYRDSGVMSLDKWAGTQKKLDPVLDELLNQYPGKPENALETAQ